LRRVVTSQKMLELKDVALCPTGFDLRPLNGSTATSVLEHDGAPAYFQAQLGGPSAWPRVRLSDGRAHVTFHQRQGQEPSLELRGARRLAQHVQELVETRRAGAPKLLWMDPVHVSERVQAEFPHRALLKVPREPSVRFDVRSDAELRCVVGDDVHDTLPTNDGERPVTIDDLEHWVNRDGARLALVFGVRVTTVMSNGEEHGAVCFSASHVVARIHTWAAPVAVHSSFSSMSLDALDDMFGGKDAAAVAAAAPATTPPATPPLATPHEPESEAAPPAQAVEAPRAARPASAFTRGFADAISR
jgi:hypothetical protein